MTLPKLVKFSELDTTQPAVMILDSGAGAHSIFRECKKLRPNSNYIIIEDKSFFPYGNKSIAQLEENFREIAQTIKNTKLISLILACNTASTHALEIFRDTLDCPVIGTVPPIKLAVTNSPNKCIALLATPATTHSSYTRQLINAFAQDVKIHLIPTPHLASISENYVANQSVCQESLSKELAPLANIAELDTIALACTHYHLIKDEISKLYPKCKIIDCSPAIAKQFDRVSPPIFKQTPSVQRCYL